jgi:hypothetical protein
VQAGCLSFWCDALSLSESQRRRVLWLLDELAN